MIDSPGIPEGVPLILTLEFPCVDPYEVLAVYRGHRRYGRGKGAPMWQNWSTGNALHDNAVSGISAWRTATEEDMAAFAPDGRREE